MPTTYSSPIQLAGIRVRRHQATGFSLIELVMTLAVGITLAALAAIGRAGNAASR